MGGYIREQKVLDWLLKICEINDVIREKFHKKQVFTTKWSIIHV